MSKRASAAENTTPQLWDYCTHPDHERVCARGFVLATTAAEAARKAEARIKLDRRRFESEHGTQPIPVASYGTRAHYRVRVWPDPEMRTAPAGRHYVEGRGHVRP